MNVFRWNDWNQTKVAKHGVSVQEAERVARLARRPYPRKIDNDKWQVVGRGQGDRWFQVIYIVDPDGTLFIIHAMPLTTRRRRG
jgi:uncharacterized DUF497 family protein